MVEVAVAVVRCNQWRDERSEGLAHGFEVPQGDVDAILFVLFELAGYSHGSETGEGRKVGEDGEEELGGERVEAGCGFHCELVKRYSLVESATVIFTFVVSEVTLVVRVVVDEAVC